jgi:hypothetical protein
MSELLMTEDISDNAQGMGLERNTDKVAIEHSPSRWKLPKKEDG